MHELPLFLPRSAFSPREAARAGDVWRLFQDIAVAGSIAAGWSPTRYRDEGCSMIVRGMTVQHHRETLYGETLTGATWPSQARRGVFFRREGRLTCAAGPVASATQEWVHVSMEAGEIRVARGSTGLVDAFTPESHGPSVALPSFEPRTDRAEHRFEFDCWHSWMDPLDHVNHPAYVDFCDEAIARVMAEAGLDPVSLCPVAEKVTFRSGVKARERARVRTQLRGETQAGDAVFDHRVEVGERLCAQATTVRRLVSEEGRSALLSL
ncbi:MAG: thioesterase family protein [Sandaracinaceae bacterium]